jgi:signal peptidase I
MAAILGMAAIGAWAVFTGQISYTVTHGVSMNPVYYQGDLVFVVKSSKYRIGEIAEYRDAKTGVDVLHRIIGGDSVTGFVFKGDNNQSIDKFQPPANQILGREFLHVPHGGVWLKPLLSPTGLGMMGFLIVGGGVAAAPRSRREIPRGRRRKRVKAMSRQGGSWAAATAALKAVDRLSPLLRAAAGLVALTGVVGLALGVLGWMKPAYEREPPTGTRQSVVYSYSAAVRRSAAYDGTTAASPDPIFRRLTDRVDVRVRYQGPPGRLAVSAKLSTENGWHATLLLITPRRFLTRSFDVTTPLNIMALDQRSQDAAKAIGIQSPVLSIALTTTVTDTGLADFTAPVTFTLAPTTLSLANGADSLVTDGASQASLQMVPRKVSVFEVPLMTSSGARSLAVMLLIGTATSATALYFVGRRRLPLHTRAEIERRYPNLLVPVEPMASPPGKPVVNVDNFPSLVKLAERYGQMILTWRRPDADDFVVRDEGITYRFRIEVDETLNLESVERIDRPSTGSHRLKAANPAPDGDTDRTIGHRVP